MPRRKDPTTIASVDRELAALRVELNGADATELARRRVRARIDHLLELRMRLAVQ